MELAERAGPSARHGVQPADFQAGAASREHRCRGGEDGPHSVTGAYEGGRGDVDVPSAGSCPSPAGPFWSPLGTGF